jgi:hypothetical protein
MLAQDSARRFLPETQCSNPFVITFLISLLSLTSVAQSPIAPAVVATGPLVADHNSHLVVMEYENWFGPKAVTFQGRCCHAWAAVP